MPFKRGSNMFKNLLLFNYLSFANITIIIKTGNTNKQPTRLKNDNTIDKDSPNLLNNGYLKFK